MNPMQQMQQMFMQMMELSGGGYSSQLQKLTALMQQMGMGGPPQNGMGMGLPQQYLQMMQQQHIQQQQQQQQQLMQNMLQIMQAQQAQQLATTCSEYGSDDSGF